MTTQPINRFNQPIRQSVSQSANQSVSQSVNQSVSQLPNHPVSQPISQPASQAAIQATLQQIWGYSSFRPPQGDIVDCLLQNRDALIILPTGGGKSVCFQLPALMQPGLTLVISPLVALMENQVQELHQRDRRFKQSVALLHSELARSLIQKTLWALENQRLRLLYLSPETLLSPAVWERLCKPELKINRLILDEAHCLVQWGDTFRPAYYRLGAVRSALLQTKPAGSQISMAAFTATADPVAQQTIQRVLQLNQPEIFRQNPYRANLNLKVQIVWTPRQRRSRLLQFIQAHPHQSGLVYVRSRRDGEELADWLIQQGFSTAAYHAGLYGGDRRHIEQDWIANTLQFVICTSAFGMGINKPDVGWIVHFHAPLLLSEYVQEMGRAGRDGNPADALTLISEPTGWLDPQDKQRRKFFETQAQKHYRTAQDLAGKLPLQGEVFATTKQFPGSAIALSLLHQSGCLNWIDPFHYALQPGARFGRSLRESPKFSQSNIAAAQQMTDYLHTKACRWQFLLNAFGFTREAKTFRCGHCDHCQE